jgi:hypothetical protein
MTNPDTDNVNSLGMVLADTEWLDNHYLAMQPEYEDMLRWVGLQSGWKVLDAACGTGSFLPNQVRELANRRTDRLPLC